MSKNIWFEKPDSSSITVNQHVLPRESIRRFCGQQDGKIDVYLKAHRKIVRTGPGDKTFCAQRVWDQKAESGPLSDIENRFQALAAAIVSGRVQTLQPWDCLVVSEMYALWRYRHLYRAGMPDIKANLGMAEQPHLKELTKEREEMLELGHVAFFRADGTFPARQMIGVQLVAGIDTFMEYAAGRSWGILSANTGEFLVPDTFGSYNVLPVSPRVVLALDHPNAVFDSHQVGAINLCALEVFEQYCFARDLSILTLPRVGQAVMSGNRQRLSELGQVTARTAVTMACRKRVE
jgi:hypothetical protein